MQASRKISFIALILCGVFCLSWKFFGNSFDDEKRKVEAYLNSEAVHPDDKLISELRQDKYKTLEWLYSEYWKENLNYESYRNNKKFLELFDRVCGQKDGIASGLFWHTDLSEALAEAKKQNKPLLSLQMLGDLREDFSCANSRFFRTLLYSNKDVSKVMREKFILCWEPVIKVPRITIEYPDGRKQIQTITGNSMHLVLNGEGEILDALPGLYGPEFFGKWLGGFSEKKSAEEIRHEQKQKWISLNNAALREKLRNEDWYDLVDEGSEPAIALKASEVSAAKIATERPVYTGVYGVKKNRFKKTAPAGAGSFDFYETYGFKWELLPSSTQTLINAKKKYSPEELNYTLQNISENLSRENVRNEVNLHSTILLWLQDKSLAQNKNEFIQKVYRELFLTPLDDNNMGLYDRSIFNATTNDGFLEE